ncbi:MAG: ethanolamine utilization protein EutJ [Anaerolineae bacterium UTCFX2]|nr:MAG: ethanolamine utilization protein EutJ [Anaerolineae bacterium UTCFX2]
MAQAGDVILPRELSVSAPPLAISEHRKLRVGVDLGTAYLVLVVLDEDGAPLAGEWQFAQVVRDGLVVDYIGATDLLTGMKQRIERRLGRELNHAASGYPPGVPRAEIRATANVIEAAGMECTFLSEEPSAANQILQLEDGVIVDVGGGTTGIALIQNGQVIYTADEPTGGTHFTLVIAGALNISFEEAEKIKVTPAEHQRLFPVVRPVIEKVASITSRHIQNSRVGSITLIGGASTFMGMADVMQSYTGIPAFVPENPVFITPLGLAMMDEPA